MNNGQIQIVFFGNFEQDFLQSVKTFTKEEVFVGFTCKEVPDPANIQITPFGPAPLMTPAWIKGDNENNTVIRFTRMRIDVEKNSNTTEITKDELNSFVDYAIKVCEFLTKNKAQIFNRIALNGNFFINNLDNTKMLRFYNKFSKNQNIVGDGEVIDWVYTETKKRIIEKEDINIKHYVAQEVYAPNIPFMLNFNISEETKIHIGFDINTSQKNNKLRFDDKNSTKLFSEFLTIANTILEVMKIEH